MRQLIALIILGLSITLNVGAQSYKFDFTSDKKTKDGYIKITSADRYANAKGYGYDLSPSPDGKNHAPFFFLSASSRGRINGLGARARACGMILRVKLLRKRL